MRAVHRSFEGDGSHNHVSANPVALNLHTISRPSYSDDGEQTDKCSLILVNASTAASWVHIRSSSGMLRAYRTSPCIAAVVRTMKKIPTCDSVFHCGNFRNKSSVVDITSAANGAFTIKKQHKKTASRKSAARVVSCGRTINAGRVCK